MTDILVTFDDGATELWADNFPLRHPGENYYPDLFGQRGDGLPAGPAAWEAAVRYASIHNPRRCGRGGNKVLVWRLTGQDPTTKALTGAWQTARIETVDEQIARLERERDGAREQAKMHSGDAEDLRARLAGVERELATEMERFARERTRRKTVQRDRDAALVLLRMEGIDTQDVCDGISKLGESREVEVKAKREARQSLAEAERALSKAKADVDAARAFEREYGDEVARIEQALERANVDRYEEVEPGGHRALSLSERVEALTHDVNVRTLRSACDAYEQELADLRAAARVALTALTGVDPGDVKAGTLAAFLRVEAKPYLGDLINARARAGAAVVEARDALRRISNRRPQDAARLRSEAEQHLAAAEAAYAAARRREDERTVGMF